MLVCCVIDLRAQGSQLHPAFGFNAGQGFSSTSNGFQLDAYYDVPIGVLYFSPGFRVMFSGNSMFSVDTRVRFPVIGESLLFGGGASVMIWEDRAAIGIPVEFTSPISLSNMIQINPGIAVTPHFFLGKEKDGIHYAAFVGLRVLAF